MGLSKSTQELHRDVNLEQACIDLSRLVQKIDDAGDLAVMFLVSKLYE